jgi:hypothetical protein
MHSTAKAFHRLFARRETEDSAQQSSSLTNGIPHGNV